MHDSRADPLVWSLVTSLRRPCSVGLLPSSRTATPLPSTSIRTVFTAPNLMTWRLLLNVRRCGNLERGRTADFILTPHQSRIGCSSECEPRVSRPYAAAACRKVNSSATHIDALAALGGTSTSQGENSFGRTTSTSPSYTGNGKMAPRDCAVWGAAHSRQSTTKDLDFKREFREKRTTPPE